MARKKQRETYGNGSITPKIGKDGNQAIGRDGKPIWRICLTLGYEVKIDENGKKKRRQRKVQRVFHGTLVEARKFCKELDEEYQNVNLEAAQGSFKWACAKWALSMTNSNAASSEVIKAYETRLGYMSAHLGSKPIIEITATDIDEAIALVKSERGLSNTTMHKVFAVTKRVFEFAVTRDWIVRNPCNASIAPKEDEVTNRKSLSAAEGARLRAYLDRDEAQAYGDFMAKEARQRTSKKASGRSCVRGISHLSGIMAIRLMLATGMRRGEACRLVWDAVDLEAGQICIRQSLTARVEVKTPKTDSGVRKLTLDEVTLQHLANWKAFQDKALSMVMPDGISLGQSEQTPVCCSDTGEWLDPTNLGRWWDKYRKTIGFPNLKMHELRHTQATMLIGNGADLKTVAHRLGHKKETLTLSQYAHAIPANDRAAADLIGSLFSEKPIPNPKPKARLVKKTA